MAGSQGAVESARLTAAAAEIGSGENGKPPGAFAP